MTPELQSLLEVSTRIREYEVAGSALEVLARLCTDAQVQAALRQQAQELYSDGARWRRRQDRELGSAAAGAETRKALGQSNHLVEPAWEGDGAPERVTSDADEVLR